MKLATVFGDKLSAGASYDISYSEYRTECRETVYNKWIYVTVSRHEDVFAAKFK